MADDNKNTGVAGDKGNTREAPSGDVAEIIAFLTDATVPPPQRLESCDAMLGKFDGRQLVAFLNDPRLEKQFKLRVGHQLYRKIPDDFELICSFLAGRNIPEHCKRDAWKELKSRLVQSAPSDVSSITAFLAADAISKAQRLEVRDALLARLPGSKLVAFFDDAGLDPDFKLNAPATTFQNFPGDFDLIRFFIGGPDVPEECKRDAWKELKPRLLKTAPRDVESIVSFLSDMDVPQEFRSECRDELLKLVPGDQLRSFFNHKQLDEHFKLGVDPSLYERLPDGVARIHGFLCATHVPAKCKSDAWRVLKSRLATAAQKEVKANQADGVKQIRQFLRNAAVPRQFRQQAVNSLLEAIPATQVLDVLSDSGIEAAIKIAVAPNTYARIPAAANKDIIDYLGSELPEHCKRQAGGQLAAKIDAQHVIQYLALSGVDVKAKNKVLDRCIAQLPHDKLVDILQHGQIPIECKSHSLPTFAEQLDSRLYYLILDLPVAELAAKERILDRHLEKLPGGEVAGFLRNLRGHEELNGWKAKALPALAARVDLGNLDAFFELDTIDWEFKKEFLDRSVDSLDGKRVFQLLANPKIDTNTKRRMLAEHSLWQKIPPERFEDFLQLDERCVDGTFKTKLIRAVFSGKLPAGKLTLPPAEVVPFLERIPAKYQNVAAPYYLDDIPREHFFRFLALDVERQYKDQALERISNLLKGGEIPEEDFNKLLGLETSCLSDEIKIQAVRHYVEKNEDLPPACPALWTEALNKNRPKNWPPNLPGCC